MFVVNHTFKHSRTEYDNQLANCSTIHPLPPADPMVLYVVLDGGMVAVGTVVRPLP